MALQYVQIKEQVDLYGNRAPTYSAQAFTTPHGSSGSGGNDDNSFF